MKILFVSDDAPLSGNYNGAASYKYAHLKLLLQLYPEAEYTLVSLQSRPGPATGTQRDELPQEYPAQTFRRIHLPLADHPAGTGERRANLLGSTFRRFAFFYPVASRYNLRRLQDVLESEAPDLIWTEQLLENYLVLRTRPTAPVVYGHHDFAWKIRRIRHRNAGRKKKFLDQLFKQAELAVIRRNRFVVSGSTVEIDELRAVHPPVVTAYLPTSYPSVTVAAAPGEPLPRLIHLGTLQATANKVGLERFLDVCWPGLKDHQPAPTLQVIGSTEAHEAGPILKKLGQPGIVVSGYVEDLSRVLRPYDVHVIPYEQNTGTRTRLALVFNYRQLLIGTRSACGGIAGLVSGENCLLVDSLAEMTGQIKAVLAGRIDRVRIADNGKAFFEREFTTGGQQDRLQTFMKQVLPGP